VANTETDRRINNDFNLVDTSVVPPVILVPIDQSTVKTELKQPRAYVYANINATPSVTWTVGVSADDYEEGTLEVESTNPKLGVLWNVTNDVRLRAAAFSVVKPALVNNRTLEPTQIAGFNQLFDDINGTKSESMAGAVDWRLNRNLAVGAEYTARKMEEPAFDAFVGDWIFEKREELYQKLYFYWTPTARIAVRTELVYDRYESERGILTEFSNLPEEVTTVSLPIGLTYFSPSGLFAGLTGTFVDQEVKRSLTATQASGEDQFLVVDAAVGYRFANRRGIVSLEVKNLLDTEFKYQDDSYREFRTEPSIGPYFPQQTILGKISLNF
jgi:hypothetical protein